MANQLIEQPVQLKPLPLVSCLHRRLIDDVMTREGLRTGQVRCLECGVVFDDPHQRLK